MFLLLQAMDQAPKFGDFADAIPEPLFKAIHIALVLVGAWLWLKARGSAPRIAWAFALYTLGEALFVLYHFDLLAFHFTHTLAEVANVIALLGLAMYVTKRA